MADLFVTLWGMQWLEFSGLVSGLLCVWLLIRRNIWTFPIGLLYAAISVLVFLEARLYADVLLSGYYLLMNAYGWYYWLEGARRSTEKELPVRRATALNRTAVGVVVIAATFLMGWGLDNHTDADLAYWDSAITVLSFAAMWMTARKYIDNWAIWFLVDVIATGVYFYKGIEFYALLYCIYLVMAILGWRAWQRSMQAHS